MEWASAADTSTITCVQGSESEIWSTLGYDALRYYWGLTGDDLNRLSESEKSRLAALTQAVNGMSLADREALIKRLGSTPPHRLAAQLLNLADELLRAP